MAKKKFTLTDLKVSSFVTSLDKRDRETAKGGIDYVDRLNILHGFGGNWTDHKSQLQQITTAAVGVQTAIVRQVTDAKLKMGR